MMYLVFLAFLYKMEGGSIRSLIKHLAGHEIEEDQTPTTPPTQGTKPGRLAEGTSISDKSVGSRLLGGGEADSGQPLTRFASSKTEGGGTFSGAYEQLPGDEEEGAASGLRQSLSIIRDGGRLGGSEGLLHLGGRHTSTKSDDGLDTIPLVTSGSDDAGTKGHELSPGPISSVTGKDSSKADTTSDGHHWNLSLKDRRVLKRRTITDRFSPLVLLSSFVSDIDVVTDWTFYAFGLAGVGKILFRFALVFAVVGTIMWALSTTEFALLSKLRVMWKNNPMSRLEHVGLGWQLLANVFVEDIPQFIITVITRPTSVTGVLNLMSSALSLVAKIVHGISNQRAASLSTQFKMIDQDPTVTRNLFRLRDEAKKKAAKAEKLVYLAWENRCAKGEAKAAAVFQVLQIDPTFVKGDLDYMKIDLFAGSRLRITNRGLTGAIPKEVGGLTALQAVVLSTNNLTGPIPAELGNLPRLRRLNLSENALTGPIPVELSKLSDLRDLNLSGNMLTGTIPAELGGMASLVAISLANNNLEGDIPEELADLTSLRTLDLSHNKLTGGILDAFGSLTDLETLSVESNMLTGSVPSSLGSLMYLKTLTVADNMLTGAEASEIELKDHLDPECNVVFLPQREQEQAKEVKGYFEEA